MEKLLKNHLEHGENLVKKWEKTLEEQIKKAHEEFIGLKKFCKEIIAFLFEHNSYINLSYRTQKVLPVSLKMLNQMAMKMIAILMNIFKNNPNIFVAKYRFHLDLIVRRGVDSTFYEYFHLLKKQEEEILLSYNVAIYNLFHDDRIPAPEIIERVQNIYTTICDNNNRAYEILEKMMDNQLITQKEHEFLLRLPLLKAQELIADYPLVEPDEFIPRPPVHSR
ncbi:MAG: hypothetical protein KIT27_06860 [Legionellales bacterium]|nr:hypothetical protein [Legionellales bacterium]